MFKHLKLSKKELISLIILLFLVISIPLGIYLINNPQILKSRAQTDFYGRSVSFIKFFGQTKISETTRFKAAANTVYHASGVVIDKTNNKLYAVDTGNNRILGFNGLDMNPGRNADLVFGQENFEEGSCNRDNNLGINNLASEDTLCLLGLPVLTNTAEYWLRNNIDVDASGNLYVPDVWNNRILKFNQPFSEDKSDGKGDTRADFVWGQDNFSFHSPNQNSYAAPGTPTNKSLWLNIGPPDWVSSRGASVDSQGNVWVADTFNNRVLRFPANSKEADLVLGQDSFNTNGCTRGGITMNRFCTPTLAKIDPATGDLYVIDEHSAPFKARILVFRPPFTSGMSAIRSIAATQGPALWPEGYIFQATGLAFNNFREGEYANGKIWVNEHSANRTLLLDENGAIIKAINVKDLSSRGGDQQYGGNCGSIYNPERLWWPGGSIGIDSDNNLYLADERFGKVFKYTLPYNLNGNCLPEPSGSILTHNQSSPESLGEAMGVAVFGNQLIVKDEGGIIKVWNDYTTRESGTSADVVLNTGLPGRGFMSQAIDDNGRMWVFNNDAKLSVYQLPLQPGSTPVAQNLKLYWIDNNQEIDYRSIEGGIAFDAIKRAMYIVDGARVLRIINLDDLNNLKVDLVLGQTDKENKTCNQSSPGATSFCDPRQLAFDKLGNLYVVDNSHECRGFNRITVFLKDDLTGASVLFPNIGAQKVFVAPDLTSSGRCAPDRNIYSPHSPISVAFNSQNQLVVANDGYYHDIYKRYLKQIWFYSDPLNNQSPASSIALPIGAPGEIAFDSNDNLIVQDHTWSKIWVINPTRDPSWLEPPDFFSGLDSVVRAAPPTIVVLPTQPVISPTITTAPVSPIPTNVGSSPTPTRAPISNPTISPGVTLTPRPSQTSTQTPTPTRVPSPSPTPVSTIYDLNKDGVLNSADVSIFISRWRSGTSGRELDFNRDGVLNTFDFSRLRTSLTSS